MKDLDISPLQRFRSVKAPRYSPRELPTDQQIEAFFHVVEQYARNPVREQIGYRLMFHLGLRLSEVAQIKWSDINLGTRTIVIHSKGKKSHVLPLVGSLYSLLQELKNSREQHTSWGKRSLRLNTNYMNTSFSMR